MPSVFSNVAKPHAPSKIEQFVLCLNTGSSSLKFALYDLRDLENVVMSGSAEKIGLPHSRLKIELKGRSFFDEEIDLETHEKAVQASLSALKRANLPDPTACVHRVVHGGPRLIEPVLIDEKVHGELKRLVTLAPLHLPNELAVIDAATRAYPEIPQVACFDTAFHQRMPEIAKRLPLPRHLWGEGIRRYGFHGLSYESIVSQLGKKLSGRSIVAHLGNGCSMVALRDGVPQDTTMGLTPTGGLMMGTRSGDLDPGVLFYLMRNLSDPSQDLISKTERTLNDESGLLGVSGISRNMEDLLKAESESIAAKESIELFCYDARKFVGSLYSVLGGLDTLVFTGGMGENSAVVRKRICAGLDFLDIRLDPVRNESNASVISQDESACTVRTLHTDENLVMAKHALSLLSLTSTKGLS
jgi:acetate kinase